MGAPALEFLPPADRLEVAFAGRSNVGKSSLINALTGQHGLARVSNTPGRTQELNFFATADVPLYLIDLPGYGFAKAPKPKVEAWTKLVKTYLRGRPTLRRVFLLIDARHGVKPVDREIMALLNEAAVSFILVLTKADKISAPALATATSAAEAVQAKQPAGYPLVLATSAQKGEGLPELKDAVVAVLA